MEVEKSITTLEALEIGPEELDDLLHKYKDLIAWDRANIFVLISLQVDLARANDVLDAIRKKRQASTQEALRLVKDLLQCANYAYSTVYNSSTKAIPVEKSGLLARMDAFLKEHLGTDPLPASDLEEPRVEMNEYWGKALCRERDSLGRGSVSTGPFCPFTDLPFAQIAHIIPVNTAGAAPNRIWFWMWIAIILPVDNYLQVWTACAGSRNNSLKNLVTMCYELHRALDSMKISLKPIAGDRDLASYKLELRTHHGEEEVKFMGLRHPNGQRFDDNSILQWGMSPNIPDDERRKYEAPSPILFSLRHYFAEMPRFLRELECGAPPAPKSLGSDELLARWAKAQGVLRTPSQSSSRSNTPQPSSSSPMYKRWASRSVARVTGSKRPRDEDYGEQGEASSSSVGSSSLPYKRIKIASGRPRGGYLDAEERSGLRHYDYGSDEENKEDSEDEDCEEHEEYEGREEYEDPESWRADPNLSFPERCAGYSGPADMGWVVPMGAQSVERARAICFPQDDQAAANQVEEGTSATGMEKD